MLVASMLSYNQPADRLVLVAAKDGDREATRHVLVRAPNSREYVQLFQLPDDEALLAAYTSERTPFGYFVRHQRVAPGAFNCIGITRFDLITGALHDVTRDGHERVPWPTDVLGELADGTGLVVRACVALRNPGTPQQRAVYGVAAVRFASPSYETIAELEGALRIGMGSKELARDAAGAGLALGKRLGRHG